jgi:molecular chaperone GrpE
MAKKNAETTTDETIEQDVVESTEEEMEQTPDEPASTPASELQQLKDQMLRDRAELENFKRRVNEERIKERKYAQLDILKKVTDVLDNLERAMNADYADVDRFKDGLKSVVKQVELLLTSESVTEIESLHQPFDANKHQAVMTDTNPEVDDQIITEVFQKGYVYKDRILRPSMVKVNHKEK